MQANHFTWCSTKETVICSNAVGNTGCVGLRDSISVSYMVHERGCKESGTCAGKIRERETHQAMAAHAQVTDKERSQVNGKTSVKRDKALNSWLADMNRKCHLLTHYFFYEIKNKISVHFTCMCTFYYIHITGYIQRHVLYGQFKGSSRLILAIFNSGFMCRP
jgi:hypothetical protein